MSQDGLYAQHYIDVGSHLNVDANKLRDACVIFADEDVQNLKEARQQIREYTDKSLVLANVAVKGDHVYAIRDIQPHEELCVHFGSDFWIQKHFRDASTPEMKILCLLLLTERHGLPDRDFPDCLHDVDSAKRFLATFHNSKISSNPCQDIRRMVNTLLTI